MIENVRQVEDVRHEAVEVAAFKKMLASGKPFVVMVSDEVNGECWRLCLADRRLPGVVNAVWWGGVGVWYRVPARRADGEWSR